MQDPLNEKFLRHIAGLVMGASFIFALEAMLKFGDRAVSIPVFTLAITPSSLIICGVSVYVFTLKFGYRGTAAFFMGAGLFDQVSNFLGGVGFTILHFHIEPLAFIFQGQLVIFGWYFAGRPRFTVDALFIGIFFSYLFAREQYFWFLVTGQLTEVLMFLYIYMQMRRDAKARVLASNQVPISGTGAEC